MYKWNGINKSQHTYKLNQRPKNSKYEAEATENPSADHDNFNHPGLYVFMKETTSDINSLIKISPSNTMGYGISYQLPRNPDDIVISKFLILIFMLRNWVLLCHIFSRLLGEGYSF